MVEVTEHSNSSTKNNSSAGNNIIDVSKPLYIHPSDSPSLLLVQATFDGVGYRSWRRGVIRSLCEKQVSLHLWEMSETKSQFTSISTVGKMCQYSHILDSHSLRKDIVNSVEYARDALELWMQPEDRYDQTNGAKLFQIQKEINDLSQGVLDITVYCTRMKKLWEELSNVNTKNQCSCVCNCGGKDNMHKLEQDRRIIQFLMGLN